MRADFRAAVVAHPGQHGPGFGAGKDRVGAEQGQRKAQLPAQRGQAGQQGHIAHAAIRGGVAAGEQPFLFHIQTDDDAQGGRVRARFGGDSAHRRIISRDARQGNAGRGL